MSADDRALLEVATVIRAASGGLALPAAKQSALIEDALRQAVGVGAAHRAHERGRGARRGDADRSRPRAAVGAAGGRWREHARRGRGGRGALAAPAAEGGRARRARRRGGAGEPGDRGPPIR